MRLNLKSSSFRYLLKEAILFLLFTYFLLFANTWRAYADYGLIRNGVILLAGATTLWLVFSLLKRWTTPTPLSLSLLLFLVVYALTALTSIQPTRSFDEVWVFGMYTFGFALVAQLVANGWPPEVFIKALLIAGSLLMGISLYLTLNWYRAWLAASGGQLIPDIAYRLPLANGQSTYLYLMLFAVITRWWVTTARVPRILLALWIVPALILLFLTASRGGWLATGVGLLVIVIVYVQDAGGFNALKNLWRFIRQRWLLSVTLGIIGFFVLIGLGWAASLQLINPQKGPALLARVEFWVPAWNAFLQRPFLGQGPLTYGSAYLRYNSVPPYGFFAHAHNTTLNLLVESGLVGVVAFGILAWVTFAAVWKQVTLLAGQDRAVAIAALAGIAAWAAHSLVDTVQVEPMNSLLIAVLLGAALGAGSLKSPLEPSKLLIKIRSGWPIVLGLILSITGIYNLWRLQPLYQGVSSSQQSDWHTTAEQFVEAERRSPGSVIAHQQSGLADSVLAQQGEPGALERAIAEYETVVKLDPDWWLNHANLAALYLAHGQTEAALREYRTASQLGSGSALLQLNYGLTAEQANQLDEAQRAYLATLDLQPELADAYYWRVNQFRQTVLKTWRGENPPQPALTPGEMQARAQGGDHTEDYLPLTNWYVQSGRLAEAKVLLQKAGLAYFTNGQSRIEFLWSQAELAAAQGDLKLALSQGQSAIEGYLAQSVLGPGAFGQAAYGEVFFRQETMAIDLVPQLTPLPLTDLWADRWVTLGDWQAQVGNAQAARAIYQRVLALVPDNQLAQKHLP